MRLKAAATVFIAITAAYTLYSYTQVDPNLVLSSHPALWQAQQAAWSIGYHQRLFSSLLYLVLMGGLFAAYAYLLRLRLPVRTAVRIAAAAIVVLGFSYPALSHDIFNYLMNAKMVWVYRADPHTHVALEFPHDPLLPFMNNVHTVAPYYYGWTALSLIPSFLGQNHLKITILLFRLFMIVWLGLLWKAQTRLPGYKTDALVAFILNPLVLIETVGNIHNDAAMMALVVWAVVFATRALKGDKRWWLPAALLFGLSVTIKYATLMLLAGWALFVGIKRLGKNLSWGGAQSIAHFLPLLTTRSQRFLPWYLIWPLSFLPSSREQLLNQTLLLFSFTAMLSYIPYLFTGGYTPQLLAVRTVIIFVPPLAYALTAGITRRGERG